MKKHILRAELAAAGAVCLGAILAMAPAVATAADDELSSAARKELAAARAASARYHDINAALADGYIDVSFCMPNMGFHYARLDLIGDGVFDPAKPEILVYAPSATANKMRLVALEYAVPLQLSDDPPEGFDGPFDYWFEDLTFGLWTLHAWVWLQNPDGLFSKNNPRLDVECPPPPPAE